MNKINVSILGVTGSIGRQTVDVIKNLPDVNICAIAAGTDRKGLEEISQIVRPKRAVLFADEGMDGLIECACMPEADIIVNAVVGSVGLKPTLAAIAAKKHVALANKETLVAAGSLVMQAAKQNGVDIRPIDSEHSAIWQCLHGQVVSDTNHLTSSVKRLILTASGGAFRNWEKSKIQKATPNDALQHPNWSMGAKITVDSATMMNKGLEYIEAHHLFNMPYKKIDILIHPQSVIHSMVEFEDGAVLAQMGMPDMGQPIQYALTVPRHLPKSHTPLDFLQLKTLNFEAPDYDRFPCLRLAMDAAQIGGTMPAMMNTANEILVSQFLEGAIGFYDISRLIEEAMGAYTVKPLLSLDDVEEAEVFATNFLKRRN